MNRPRSRALFAALAFVAGVGAGAWMLRALARTGKAGAPRRNAREPGLEPDEPRPSRHEGIPAPDLRPPGATAVEELIRIASRGRNDPGFVLADSEGRLTARAIKLTPLDSAQAEFVQAQLDDLRHTLTRLTEAKTKLVPGRSSPRESHYRISAFAPEAESAFGAFLDALERRLGGGKSWLLAKAFHVEQGGFGRNEIVVKVSKPAPGGLATARFEMRDPVSGRVLGSGMSQLASFNSRHFSKVEPPVSLFSK